MIIFLASQLSCVAMWSYLSLVTYAIIQNPQFLSPHSCRCFVINCWYTRSQAWYCNAKCLTYPLSIPLGQGKFLIITACISSTCITRTSWVPAAWKNTAWQKTTVIMGQLEKASLLAEKSWHLDSKFFQRQWNHIVQWIVPGTIWSHEPQETNRIKQ